MGPTLCAHLHTGLEIEDSTPKTGHEKMVMNHRMGYPVVRQNHRNEDLHCACDKNPEPAFATVNFERQRHIPKPAEITHLQL